MHDTDITTKSYSGIGINVDPCQGEDTGNIIIDVEFGRIDTANRNGYAIRAIPTVTAPATSISTLPAPSSEYGGQRVPTASMAICIKPAAIVDVYAEKHRLYVDGRLEPTVSGTPGCNKHPWAG